MMQTRIRRTILAAGVALAAVAGAGPAPAQFPDKPIRIVIPFAAGGASDIAVRTMQKAWDKHVSQPLVVLNKPGAGGILGNREVKDAPPDGYTLLSTHQGMSVNQALGQSDFNYTAFEPIAQTGVVELLLVVPKQSPFTSLKDVIDAARARPDTVTHATNIASLVHFAMLQAQAGMGVSFRYVQVGGGGARLPFILGGHADTTLQGVSEVIDFHKGGQARALVIFADQRWKDMPDVPTAKELGYDFPPVRVGYWWFAPKGTPRDRVDALSKAIRSVFLSPEVQAEFDQRGFAPTFVDGEAFRALVKRDHDNIVELAHQFNLKPR